VTQTHLSEPRLDAAALIRNEPVQARSTARLAALLDAAAQVVDEIGYERLTTAMVADRAGASIGTVYRYFPDRIAVLQSLAARNAERMMDRVEAQLRSAEHPDWAAAMGAVFEMLVEAFRTEPGFASLRLGDVIDLRPASGSPANSILADRMFDALVERFGFDGTDEARVAFEAAIEVTDALVARAFARDPQGYAPFLEHGRQACAALLAPYFGAPGAGRS
jgi:AcrR family transcriptional regulator